VVVLVLLHCFSSQIVLGRSRVMKVLQVLCDMWFNVFYFTCPGLLKFPKWRNIQIISSYGISSDNSVCNSYRAN